MTGIIALAFLTSYLMVIWLKTNAFAEYMTLFKLDRFFHIDEFNKLHKEGYGGTYVEFLFEYYHDLFLVRLVSCPICLSFWLGLVTAIFSGVVEGTLLSPLILSFYLLFNKLL